MKRHMQRFFQPIVALSLLVSSGPSRADETDFFLKRSHEIGGEAARAAEFLVKYMPEGDRRTMSSRDLLEDLKLALEARKRFPWAAKVPDEIFFNNVLPYASLDERREPWRRKFIGIAGPLVKSCRSSSEAARALNRKFFNAIGVHYSTGRRAPNQSPGESIGQGKASCTGLSIILVDACRSVGIPARIAGTAQWANKPGNHTWVEIWDDDWHFTGADEFDPAGLDRGWFIQDAAFARADSPTAIIASSWVPSGRHFPLAWNPEERSVPAVDVTARYLKIAPPAQGQSVSVRLFDVPGGKRITANLELLDAAGKVLAKAGSKSGRADMNDGTRFAIPPGLTGISLRATRGGKSRGFPVPDNPGQATVLDFFWDGNAVSR